MARRRIFGDDKTTPPYQLLSSRLNMHRQIWFQCSVSCGVGVQYREVLCVARTNKELVVSPASNCNGSRPVNEQVCRASACTPTWFTSNWSKVNRQSRVGRVDLRSLDHRDFLTLRYKYPYKYGYKYQHGFSVLGDMRHRSANQTGSLYSRGCQQLELRGCCET